MDTTGKIKLQGSLQAVHRLRGDLARIEGFDSDWLRLEEPEMSDDDGLGQVDLASVVIAIPVGIISNSLYDLIKAKVSQYIEAKRLQPPKDGGKS